LSATSFIINKKPAVTVTYSGPTFRGETAIYNIWRVPGTGVNATNILDKVLVATTTALTATDTTNSLKAGATYTYFVIVQTQGNFSSLSNPKSVTTPAK